LRDAPDPRNSGRAASLFVDGHVENLDVKNMDETARRRHFLA
jgi:prepilin-type processing-associated H-X9-DG protein